MLIIINFEDWCLACCKHTSSTFSLLVKHPEASQAEICNTDRHALPRRKDREHDPSYHMGAPPPASSVPPSTSLLSHSALFTQSCHGTFATTVEAGSTKYASICFPALLLIHFIFQVCPHSPTRYGPPPSGSVSIIKRWGSTNIMFNQCRNTSTDIGHPCNTNMCVPWHQVNIATTILLDPTISITTITFFAIIMDRGQLLLDWLDMVHLLHHLAQVEYYIVLNHEITMLLEGRFQAQASSLQRLFNMRWISQTYRCIGKLTNIWSIMNENGTKKGRCRISMGILDCHWRGAIDLWQSLLSWLLCMWYNLWIHLLL